VARIYRVAPHDPVLSLAFQRVVHMLDAPGTLFAPHLLWRVLTGRTTPLPAAAAPQATPRAGAAA
jgi:hypothetical protein